MTPLMAKPAMTFPNSNPEVHQVSSALYRSLLKQLEIKTSKSIKDKIMGTPMRYTSVTVISIILFHLTHSNCHNKCDLFL